ncbi:unnamed protein product [Arabidopsis lyrata]|uniref:uncharacterized protein LOC110228142 n=1 Tax=Arabidopsis lyrata subsp. lyrata TaxID=81972 RepID=UPI000A29BA74|nr:uncharacterized protein LOC110228142 [Arabidopsis lyrata subsp. lyrata]CAH8269208.1 unnamed protein product [Arabidopsis lyrata]|eukprot:XP_020880099.1 uncharacterized protein LOC110228142 [Arabidopsis lyrata subsp. lyrata]
MILTWLTRRKKSYYRRIAIDALNKNIESWDRDREAYLEQADMESEQAKKYVQKGDEEAAKYHLSLKLLANRSAQHCQELLLHSHKQLIILNRLELQSMDDDLTTHNPMHIFTMSLAFCLFLFLITYFVFF